ncbi:MAG: hypothetical protein QNJ05_12725, partial [Woeseiaceae bacterium]|nr:hypothetical protein [Woeseiaceae bacterium]
MKNLIFVRALIIAVASVGLIAGCGKSKEAGTAFSDETSLLRYVPADSPYVFARLAPMPDDYRARVKPHMDVINAENRKLIEQAVLSGQDDAGELTPEAREILELVTDLSDLMSTEGLQEAGIGPDAQVAIYGNELLPVLRVELDDTDAFNAKIADLVGQADLEVESAELAGKSYRHVTFDKLKLLLLVDSGQAVFSLAPADHGDDQLQALLGLAAPDENIAEAGVLAEIAEKYDFQDQYIGYTSSESLLSVALASGGLIDQAMIEQGQAGVNDTLSDACRSELEAMSSVAPRIVMGLRRADANGVDSSVIFELREDIAKSLKGLASPVPGLGTLTEGLAIFGMSFNAKVARDFAVERLEAMVAEPYKCEFMAGFNGGAAQALEFMKRQPVPPTAYDFKGFILSLESIEGLQPGADPTDIKGKVSGLLAIDNPESLMALGNMFVPEIAALNLQPDGDVVSLPTDRLGPNETEAWISMSDNAIGVAAGEGGDQRLTKLMKMSPNKDAPLMHANVDAESYIKLVSQATQMGLAESGQAAVQESSKAMMDEIAKLYERMSVDIRMTEHGIEM